MAPGVDTDRLLGYESLMAGLLLQEVGIPASVERSGAAQHLSAASLHVKQGIVCNYSNI